MAVDISEFTSISVSGDVSTGGWTGSLVVSRPSLITHFLTLLAYVRECFGESLAPEADFLLIKGQVVPQSIRVDWQKSRAEVVVATSHDLLNLCEIQAVAYSRKASPQNLHQMTTLSIPYIVQHMLQKHCNVVYDAADNPDGWVTLDNLNLASGDDTFTWYTVRRGYIWPIIRNLAEQEGKIAFFNREDDLYYDYHPMFKSPLPDKVVTLDDSMWEEITPIPRQIEVSQVKMQGEQDDGTIVEATFPPAIKPYGRTTSGSVRCNDASVLANIAEYAYRMDSRPYDVVVRTIASQFNLGDRIGITFADGNIEWFDEDFYIQSVKHDFDLEHGKRITELRLIKGN